MTLKSARITGLSEMEMRWMKEHPSNVEGIAKDVELILQEIFVADVERNSNKVTVLFPNNQKFQLMIHEIVD